MSSKGMHPRTVNPCTKIRLAPGEAASERPGGSPSGAGPSGVTRRDERPAARASAPGDERGIEAKRVTELHPDEDAVLIGVARELGARCGAHRGVGALAEKLVRRDGRDPL